MIWCRRIPEAEQADAPMWRWFGHFAVTTWEIVTDVEVFGETAVEIFEALAAMGKAVVDLAKAALSLMAILLLTLGAPITWPLLAVWRRYLARAERAGKFSAAARRTT